MLFRANLYKITGLMHILHTMLNDITALMSYIVCIYLSSIQVVKFKFAYICVYKYIFIIILLNFYIHEKSCVVPQAHSCLIICSVIKPALIKTTSLRTRASFLKHYLELIRSK